MDLTSIGWLFCVFLVVCEVRSTNSLSGNVEQCTTEGKPVMVEHKCFSCTCKNHIVECRPDFRTEGCHFIVKENGTCEKCKGCVYNGRYHESYTEWTEPHEPCKALRCEAGVVTESAIRCHTPCRNPIAPARGQCCKRCPECKINGLITTEDRDVTSDDPCLKCSCKQGLMTCSKKACPVLQCPITKQIREKGDCCPRCHEKRAFIPIPDKCFFNHNVYDKKRMYEVDKCTKCKCVNETFICNRHSCPILDCAPDYQQNVPGECCKKCVMPEEFRSQCAFNGVTYEEDESWKLNECSSCTCKKGMPSCAMTICNVTQSCPAGTRHVHKPGECCGKCEENEGACMAFGDPHYKTFDGKIYTFEGFGKYMLVSDCHWRSFSVRVANEYTNRSKQQSTITKRVAIKYGTLRVNLGQRDRVKVNGERVNSMPYKIDGKLSLNRRDFDTHLTLENGVKILWDGKSFLEVIVPIKYKGKLCGLCGNFNSDAEDDFKMRRGPVVDDEKVFQFATSWFMGKNPPKRKNKQCKIRSKFPIGKNLCKYLTSSELFNQCDSKLNYKMYHKTCLMDMCDCPSGKCYCDSLRAYAQECQRLNVSLSAWRKNSYCSPDMLSNGNNNNRNKPTRFVVPIQEQIETLLKQRGRNNNNKMNNNKGLGLSSIPIN